MSHSLGADLGWRVITAISGGLSTRKAARRFSIGVSTAGESPVIAPGRSPAPRAGYRHLPRDGSFLVEPVRSAVRRGDQNTARYSSFIFELALAPGRSICPN